MAELSVAMLDAEGVEAAVGCATAKRVFFSAGEASGDAYAAALLDQIAALCGVEGLEVPLFEAIGASKLRSKGVMMVADSSRWGAVGITESVFVSPRVIRGFYAAKRCLQTGPPGLFIPIDFGFFNIRLARVAKASGWTVLYFSPPGSWRRDRQGADLPGVSDAIVTPFSWSADLLNKSGANAYCFGHPLKQMIRDADVGSCEGDTIAILPGSREHEVRHNLPPIAEALSIDPPVHQIAEFALSSSSTVDSLEFKARWKRLAPDRKCDRMFWGETYRALSQARAGIICSGTATLEAALCGCPCVTVYRGSKLMELEYRLRRPKFTYMSLPNIILDRQVLPELIQWEATPLKIRAHLDQLLEDSPLRQAQLDAFAELDELLGPADALTQTAALAMQMLPGARHQ